MRKKYYQRQSEAVLASALMRCYYKELEEISEALYCSLIFEDGYPTLSSVFERIGISEMNIFKNLGRMILSLGKPPRINLGGKHSGVNIIDVSNITAYEADKIISYAIKRAQEGIEELEAIRRICNDTESDCALEALIFEKKDSLRMLEKLLRS
jgi:hypothetical protein